jgi:Ferredoxin-like domain in Api92-like protein
MPNHITNKLVVNGTTDQKSIIFQSIGSADDDNEIMQIDFRKIIPMPESLMIESGSLGDMAYELLFGQKKKSFFLTIEETQKWFSELNSERQKQAVDLALKYNDNIKNHGYPTWYDWSIENWGTKWNAYGQNDKRNTHSEIYFETAWSAPVPVIKKLSELFPHVEFELTYADEDTGSNAGILKFKNGNIENSYIPDGQSKNAYDIYFSLHPESNQ